MKNLNQQKVTKTIEAVEVIIIKMDAINTRIEFSKKLELEINGDEVLLKLYQQQLEALLSDKEIGESSGLMSNMSNYGQEKVIDGIVVKTSMSVVDISASAVEHSGELVESLGICVVDTTAAIIKA